MNARCRTKKCCTARTGKREEIESGTARRNRSIARIDSITDKVVGIVARGGGIGV